MTGGCGPGQAGVGLSRGGIRGHRDAGAEVVVCRVSAETRSLDKGVVLYDGQCGFRSRWVRYWAGTLAWRIQDRLARRALGCAEDQDAARRVAHRHTVANAEWCADFRRGCLFVCDAADLVGLAFLCDFQFARVQPVGPRGLSVGCAKPILRLAYVQTAATLIARNRHRQLPNCARL